MRTISAALFNQLLADDGVATLAFFAVRTGRQLRERPVPDGPPRSGGNADDGYLFEVTSPTVLTLTTATPYDGPHEPVNTVDPF